jgi:hypothetical protein
LLNNDTNGRIELKYRLSYFQYLKIRNAIYAHMKKDRYTSASIGSGYLVRSLYYDTYDYSAFFEKMSGDSNRIKFRLRSYSDKIDDAEKIRVEIKVRRANLVEKHSTFVSKEDYQYFIRRRCWPTLDNPILAEFERYLHLKDLRPQVLVEYYREGYESRSKDGIRITFDHKVRSGHSATLFPEHLFFKVHHPHIVVAEIKFNDKLPSWLRTLVQSQGLKIIANSKFTQGIQVARQDLHHPEGIVVVR